MHVRLKPRGTIVHPTTVYTAGLLPQAGVLCRRIVAHGSYLGVAVSRLARAEALCFEWLHVLQMGFARTLGVVRWTASWVLTGEELRFEFKVT